MMFSFLCSIADGLGLLGDIIGSVVPSGGQVVSSAAKGVSGLLKMHEYDRYQSRMSLIIEDRDILQLNDLARQVARELADRYEEQLLKLKTTFDEELTLCNWCRRLCRCFRRENRVDSAGTTKSPSDESPVKHVVQFGVAFAIQSILDERSEDIGIRADMETHELAQRLVELICRAKANLTAKVLRRMNLNQRAILPYTDRDDTTEGKDLSPWHLHDFYPKAGIYVRSENGEIDKQTPLSWMNVVVYGYRLGTTEEYNNLAELDKQQAEKKCQICFC